jgi:hypothetical protein
LEWEPKYPDYRAGFAEILKLGVAGTDPEKADNTPAQFA